MKIIKPIIDQFVDRFIDFSLKTKADQIILITGIVLLFVSHTFPNIFPKSILTTIGALFIIFIVGVYTYVGISLFVSPNLKD